MASQEEAESALWEAMRMPFEDGGRVVTVRGAPGVGKTYLLERFVHRARAAGAVVREATGVPTEREVALRLVKGLFGDDDIVRDAGHQLEAAHCCDVEVARLCGPCQSLASRMYSLIERSLRSAGSVSRVVLVVDDLHFSDTPSLWVLRSLLSRVQRLPVLLVVSGSHIAPSRQFRDFRFDTERNPTLLSLELSLFTSREAAKLMRKVTGKRPTAAYMTEAMALTGGNARLLVAVGRGTRELPQPMDSPKYKSHGPSPFQGAVRLLVCDNAVAELERVARAMAVLGGGRPAALISALSGVGLVETAQAVALIDTMGLISDGYFRHPAIRAAILEDPDFKERGEFHRSAAQLLYEQGAGPREVADCLIVSGVATRAWERAVLREAARYARAEGEWHEAVRCLELARTTLSDPAEHAEVLMEVACAKWRVDVPAALSHLPELVSHVQKGRMTKQDVLSVSGMLAWAGYARQAEEILGLLSDSDGSRPDRGRDLVECSAALGAFPAGPDTAIASATLWWGDETVAVIDTCGTGAPTTPLLSKEMIHSYLLDADQSNWVMDIGYFTTRLLHHACRGLAMFPCDGLADEDIARMSPFRRMILHCLRAVTALDAGRPAEAENEARSAIVGPANWGVYVGLPLGVLILAQVQQGRFEDVKSTLRIPVPAQSIESEFGRLYMHARGMYRLAIGMSYSALGDFLTCGEIEKRLGIPPVRSCPWQAWAARAYLLLGRREEAVRIAEAAIAVSDDAPTKAVGLKALALTRPVEDRADLLREAIGLLESSGHRVDLAFVLDELGRTYHSVGHVKAGRALIRQAWNMARFGGFEPLMRAVRASEALQEGIPLPMDDPDDADTPQDQDASADALARSVDTLSSAERRVAWLAGIGHSNREVAERLCITVSTVEQHLTKIYRKLGLKQRKDLVTAVPIPPDGVPR
ncbi:AAA family ATPase [Streptomyces sp. NPDC057424]|uniref:helix-turn-helix transcriptional regulator n=1 Tax=Streptomyces sp. NPDC057424 TaxID=3346127 RepID=UPI00369FCEBA